MQAAGHELQNRVAAVVDQVDNVEAETLTETGQEVEGDNNERRVGLLAGIGVLRPFLEFEQLLLDDLQASLKDAWSIGSKGSPCTDSDRGKTLWESRLTSAPYSNERRLTCLEKRYERDVVIRQRKPLLHQRRDQYLKVFLLAQGGSDGVGKSTDGVVKDEQVTLLVLVERSHETLQDRLHVWLKHGAGLFLERSKGAASCFLHPLVGVEDHAQ